jgi:integrase
MLAAYTGLRRGEIKQLVWDDVHLDEKRPYILARASTTKKKKTATLPLVPQLAQMLKDWREQQHTLAGTVFKRSVPTAVTLLKDLAACGIKGVDENGRHLDFHALRHTFATMLARVGVSPRVAMELMRHSDMRLTAKTYTDAMNLPLFGELEKLTPLLPSLIASLNYEKPGLEGDISDQSDSQKKIADRVLTGDERTVLTNLVPLLENFEVAERGGFEPPIRLLTV